ncbi:uncharacterized protein LOC135471184 [Liolophura sinensis]|uniref:uncharacterized protein LOC135471184 n=1 Tax=Liolophura sinensis TaxID=3198878 RepID=UPI003158A715
MAATYSSNTEAQEAEIVKLKETFPDQIRVIKNLGEFIYVVNVHPEGLDVNIKFQLTELYPKDPPNIFVKFGNKADGAEELANQLVCKSHDCVGLPMIEKLVNYAIEQIDVMELDVQTQDKYLNKQKPRGKKKNRPKKKHYEDEVEEKKVSMKTAGDVISRILWDESLPSDQFTVGYMDRFVGMVEKNFSAFSWEDLASVDYTVLAIPKHRIHYFKYKDLKVWDKDKRMDNVFGSTGSNMTITDAMEQYETQRRVEQTECDENADVESNLEVTETDDSDDDSDDDGIQITIGAIDKPYVDEDENEQDVSDTLKTLTNTEKEFWEDKLRPNYFLALRITDQEIIKNVEKVRNAILKAEPRYGDCCIPNSSLHVTLCVIRLDTDENVKNAVQILQKAKSELANMAPKGKALKLDGVSNFYDRVIYAKVQYPPEFLGFVDHLKMCLWEGGVSNKDGYEFVPHMTIMKVSRPAARLIGTSKVNPNISAAHTDTYFGTQSIDGIHLCAMGDDRREDGFYITPVSIDFGMSSVVNNSVIDSETLSDLETEFESQVPRVTRQFQATNLSDRIRSNYFLTVKINDPNVIKNVDIFQQMFREKEPIFQDFCIPSNDLHITFGTLRLETPEEITVAMQVLSDAQPKLQNICPKDKCIKIEGLGLFFERVIYARVSYPPQFLELLSSAVQCLVQAGFQVREKEHYVPHLTLVRVSQQDVRVRKLKKLEERMYEKWTNTTFGSQGSIRVHLCPVGELSKTSTSFGGN